MDKIGSAGIVRERVLVVEDDPQMSRVLERILAGEGYRCTRVGDLAKARAQLADAPFDLILCDVGLPDGSGLDLIEEVVPQHEQMATLMVSGLDEISLADRALELGAYGYIVKPFTANEVLIGVLGALRRQRAELDARAVVKSAHEETVQRLCMALEARDPAAALQISQVSGFCWHVARQLGLAPEECDLLRMASPMHDVGNVAVPDQILLKSGTLTPSERAAMQRHAEIGYRILAGSGARILQIGSTIAWTHHERFDGSGYPRGLRGEEIPLAGRITAVADVFVALTRDRVHRRRLSRGDALEIMRDEREQAFDPGVLDAFLAVEEQLAAEKAGPEVGMRTTMRAREEEDAGAGIVGLSPRERQVLQLAADGRSAQEIAETLVVSPGTVKTHFQRIYAKLDARDRAGAVATGMRRGLIE